MEEQKVDQEKQEEVKGECTEKEGKEALMEFKNEFNRAKESRITFTNIPEPTFYAFKELARAEFSGNYGMTLKWLLDYYLSDIKFGDFLIRLVNLDRKVDNITMQLGADEAGNIPATEKIIARTMGGKVLKKPIPQA